MVCGALGQPMERRVAEAGFTLDNRGAVRKARGRLIDQLAERFIAQRAGRAVAPEQIIGPRGASFKHTRTRCARTVEAIDG